jgi:glycosyltransferase involved in cell wall biosynthesis
MDSLRVSILIPSAYRARKLERLLNAIYASELIAPVEVLVCLMCDDDASLAVAHQFPLDTVLERSRDEYPGGSVVGWNRLSQYARYEWLATFADDLIPERHWLIEAQAAAQQLGKPGVIGLNDLHTDGSKYATHYLVHHDFLTWYCGGMLIHPAYRSWWFDVEMCEIAQEHDAYLYAERAIVEHVHYDWDRTAFDQTYVDSIALHEVDHVLYENRKAAGFPYG